MSTDTGLRTSHLCFIYLRYFDSEIIFIFTRYHAEIHSTKLSSILLMPAERINKPNVIVGWRLSRWVVESSRTSVQNTSDSGMKSPFSRMERSCVLGWLRKLAIKCVVVGGSDEKTSYKMVREYMKQLWTQLLCVALLELSFLNDNTSFSKGCSLFLNMV